ncbi:MAG: FimB/Mfa2 family fimbrial subunit [Alistipes sp.]|nr:FimB/Mfa2 family fimbrial subunit [Alistipes sp.]
MDGWKARLLPLLFVVIFAAGCVGESYDECDTGGYNLVFYYPGNGTSDIFHSKIDHVRMLVYDSAGYMVDDSEIDRESLEQYQGIRLDLPSGHYTVVCWGNIADYSWLTDTDPLAEGRLYQRQYIAGEVVEDFDSLYFGRRDIYIDTSILATDTLTFVSAHIGMEIHIEGYDGRITTRAQGQGIIELTDVSVGYNFAMELTPQTTAMYPVWETSEQNGEIHSNFKLLRFDDDTPIVINIRSSDNGQAIGSVVLGEFLRDNGIDVEGVNEITVPIYITFDEQGIRVSVDPWETEPVVPLP